ncbi:epoxide hydrolase family protein [Nonomuraea sp. SBT364]|uniref:epoxide hydrolase family protein n=1 Tax=Nonomuraea sp. SBT364 TaxID=1580530 RepID=UPI00066CB120|nr:epoxide hydrolase family protein [Nonomuraea sp. SBT364]
MRPFTIDFPQRDLDDLRRRLRDTRWPDTVTPDTVTPDTVIPDTVTPAGWDAGPPASFMRRLVGHWLDGYDWRAVEADLNRLNHFTTPVRGMDVHFVNERASGGAGVPVVLLHGWADSFHRYTHLIGRLGDFDVVVPSLPGFAFSAQPHDVPMTAGLAAEAVAGVMETLGYDRYVVHGGDWGSTTAQELARLHPGRVMGLHLTDVPFPSIFLVDEESATPAERRFLEGVHTWAATETGYVAIQSTKPQTLSYGLADSPAGLAAWLIQHFHALSETMPADDDLITNVMLYWIGNSIRSSIRYYAEGMQADPPGRVAAPTGLALFPKDIGCPPREFAERFFDVTRYTVMDQGGHFAALEVPDLVAGDLRAFVGTL